MNSVYDYLKGKGYFGDDDSEDMTDEPTPKNTPNTQPTAAEPVAAQYVRTAADTSKVDAARDYADRATTADNFFNVLSGLSGPKPANAHTMFSAYGQQARDAADQAAATQKQRLADVVTTDKLQQEGVDRGRATTDWNNKQGNATPGTPQAKQAAILYKSALLAKATEADAAAKNGVAGAADAAAQLREQAKTAGNDMSANDIMTQHGLIKDIGYDKVLEMGVKSSTIAANNAVKQSQIDAHNTAVDDKAAAAKAAEERKAWTTANKAMRGEGRVPADVRQSYANQLAADNAGELLKGNLNALSPEQARLVAAEVEKMATNGSGTEGGRKGMLTKTAASDWAEFKNRFVGPNGEVSGADLAPFLQKHKEYIQEMKQVANKHISDFRRSVYNDHTNTYGDNEHTDAYRTAHPELFPEDQAAASTPAVGGTAPAAPGQTQKPSWAK